MVYSLTIGLQNRDIGVLGCALEVHCALLKAATKPLWFSASSHISDYPTHPICHTLVTTDHSLTAANPVERPGVEAIEDTVDIPTCTETQGPELDEGEVEGIASVSIEDGSVDIATERIVDGGVGADGKSSPPYPEVVGEAEEGAQDVVDEVSVNGGPPTDSGEQSSTLDAEIELVTDFAVDRVDDGATEQASGPAMGLVTEPEPEPEPSPVPEHVAELGVNGLGDIPVDVVVEEGPATTDNEALAVTILW